MIGFHFLKDDYRTGVGRGKPWTVGETRSLRGGIIRPCERGYHASPTLFDALQYAPGSIACLVELIGDVTPHGDPVDKYAARSRRLIAAVNIERELRLYAVDCAERVLPLYEREYPDDDRPRQAIVAARAFANGEIDRDALAAAARATAGAAGDAARATAWDAARATAWDAAVDAAWAAGAAAWDAARATAWDAAGDAAWDAAGDAAWAAAWDAARAAGAAAWDAARATAWAAGDAAEREWQRAALNERTAHVFDGVRLSA